MNGLTAAAILADTLAHGFDWKRGIVKHQGMELGTVPLITVTDAALFVHTFPARALGALNGTSIDVSCESITRRRKWKERAVSEDTLKEAIVQWLIGATVRSPSTITVERKIYLAIDGTEFDTADEAKEYSMELMKQ